MLLNSGAMKIVQIGSGNVATHLGKALHKAGHRILQVYGRTEKSASRLAKYLKAESINDLQKLHPKADVYFIALKDEAIAEIISFIPNKKAIVLHTSGSVSIDIFPNSFSNACIAYPLQTFSLTRKLDISNVPFCLESRNPSTKVRLRKLIHSISEHTYWINSDERKTLHLAAVFANNFSNHLFVIAEELLKKKNLPFDLLRPLILETAKKVQQHSALAMQTGPARRGDVQTLEKHLKLLADSPDYAALYSLFTDSIEAHNGAVL